MKRFSHPLLRLLLIGILFAWPVSASAGALDAPERETSTPKVQGSIDPYEVILYHHKNYNGSYKSWRLAPGMRMLKISKLDDIPRSILLGSKVGLILFPNYNFSSNLLRSNNFLISYFRVNGSTPNMDYHGLAHIGPKSPFSSSSKFSRCSLIIYRKDLGDILGVYLRSGKIFLSGKFYPLPEKAKDAAIIHDRIPQGSHFKLSIVAAGNGQISTYPPTSHPNQHDIQITVSYSNGGKRILPGPNSKDPIFKLTQSGQPQISSLNLRYKGPLDEQAYLDQPLNKHRAPPASSPHKNKADTSHGSTMSPGKTTAPGNIGKSIPTVEIEKMATSIPDVSGQWKSNIGVVYAMTQKGDRFQWTVSSKNETGNGFIKGRDLSASWKSSFGSGASNGKITAVDPSGKATKIQWHNGVQFHR